MEATRRPRDGELQLFAELFKGGVRVDVDLGGAKSAKKRHTQVTSIARMHGHTHSQRQRLGDRQSEREREREREGEREGERRRETEVICWNLGLADAAA